MPNNAVDFGCDELSLAMGHQHQPMPWGRCGKGGQPGHVQDRIVTCYGWRLSRSDTSETAS